MELLGAALLMGGFLWFIGWWIPDHSERRKAAAAARQQQQIDEQTRQEAAAREGLDDDDDFDDDPDEDKPLDAIRDDLDQIKDRLGTIVLLLLIIGGLALARLYHLL